MNSSLVMLPSLSLSTLHLTSVTQASSMTLLWRIPAKSKMFLTMSSISSISIVPPLSESKIQKIHSSFSSIVLRESARWACRETQYWHYKCPPLPLACMNSMKSIVPLPSLSNTLKTAWASSWSWEVFSILFFTIKAFHDGLADGPKCSEQIKGYTYSGDVG